MFAIRLPALSALLVGANGDSAAQQASAAVPSTRLVDVEPGIRLDVLDWGGTGRPVGLLGGYGRAGHDVSSFCRALAVRYHAYSVTRRGFGASSKPASDHAADRLGDDLVVVIDSLRLVAPIVAAHCSGGEALSAIGSRHSEKVGGLVHRDAACEYAFCDEADREGRANTDLNSALNGLLQLGAAADSGNADEAHRSISRLRTVDLPAPQSPLQEEGMRRYTSVRAPLLVSFALQGTTDTVKINDWRSGRRHELVALRRASPQARVVILPDFAHVGIRLNESDVLRELGAFMWRATTVW